VLIVIVVATITVVVAVPNCFYRSVHQEILKDCVNSRPVLADVSVFLISINQIDLCHTSNISSKGWFIHLFEKNKVKILKEKEKRYIF